MSTLDQRREALDAVYHPWQRRTIADRFDDAVARHGDRPLVMTEARDWTYREVAAEVDRTAAGLLALGIRRREHVAMIMANHPEYVVVKLALAKIGAVAVPLNFALKKDENAYLLEQSDSAVLVTMDRFRDQDYLAQLDAIVPGWRDRDASARDGTAPAPRLRHVVVFPTGGDAPGGVLTLEALQARGEQVSTDDVTRRQRESAYPDEVADILYTSGTTSLPKGVMLTHDMLWRSALSTAYARGYEDGRRIFFPMPLYHVFGYVEGLLAAILVGGAIVPQLIFDPTAALRLIADKRVSEALFVPSALVALLHAETLEQFDLSALRSVFCASAPAPVWLWEQVQRDLGLEEVHTGYGMTEVSAATVATRQGDSIETVASTVGRVMPGGPGGLDEFGGANTQYKVIDPISGEDLADGAEGELVCRGNIVTRGYYRKPIETAEAIDGDGWLRSGDLGRIRPDGSIELTGRSKDIYIVNGENVTPKESEECLGRHPAVEQAFVVGVPDERRGEVGVAWVVRKAGADPSPEELLDHVREHLARHKVPAHVLFIDVADLPTTASGKIQKFRLRERAIVDLDLGTVQDTMSVPRRAAEPG